jgi:hypothetical protein
MRLDGKAVSHAITKWHKIQERTMELSALMHKLISTDFWKPIQAQTIPHDEGKWNNSFIHAN